jgi:hypothetical protein
MRCKGLLYAYSLQTSMSYWVMLLEYFHALQTLIYAYSLQTSTSYWVMQLEYFSCVANAYFMSTRYKQVRVIGQCNWNIFHALQTLILFVLVTNEYELLGNAIGIFFMRCKRLFYSYSLQTITSYCNLQMQLV